MRAIRVDSGQLSLADIERPKNDLEALVRVVRSGICNTDLEIIRGYGEFSGTIGHEFVGIVEEALDRPELVGKRVVGEINAGCGACELCLSGDSRHCPDRTVLGIHGRDGCHAEFLNLPSQNLVEVPANVSDNEAVFAEPLAAAYGISESVDIMPETRIAVIGDGKIGLLCALALGQKTKNIILVGKHQSKLAIAGSANIEGILASESGKLGRSFDVVVEASGSETGFAAALDIVKPRGKIVLKSTFHGTPAWQASRVVVDEITIVGSRCGRFAPALKLLAKKTVNVAGLISEEFPLAKGIEAIRCASKSGVLKVLLNANP